MLKSPGLWVKLAISAVIMAALMARMDFAKAAEMIGQIKFNVWALASGFIILQIMALSYRWMLLVNTPEPRVTYNHCVRVNLASMLANYLFITSVGGIIARVAMTMQQGISFIRTLAATAVDRFMTLFALLVLATLFLPVVNSLVSHDFYYHAVLVISTLLIAAFLFSWIVFETFRRKIIFSNRKVTMVYKYMRSLSEDQGLLGRIVGSSLVAQVCYFAAAFTVAASLGAEFSWFEFFAILPLITIVASVPLGYGGWGIREGAFIYGLGLIHVPVEQAFAASVQIGFISMIAAFAAGVPVLMFGKSSALPHAFNRNSAT